MDTGGGGGEQRSCIYGLRRQARSLCPVYGNTDRSRFLVGTLGLKHDNEIHHLDFDEDELQISSVIYRHPNEIWSLSTCPYDQDLFFSTYTIPRETGVQVKATLWRLSPGDFQSPSTGRVPQTLEDCRSLDSFEGSVRSILWEPIGGNNRFAVIDDATVHLHQLDESVPNSTDAVGIQVPGSKGNSRFSTGTWNPHSFNELATANESCVRGWDLRSAKSSFAIDQAHSVLVRSIDFNSNKPNYIVTAGDDCKIRFWDVRNTKQCLKQISGHSHWVWNVAFNRFHDQLVLTAGSDTLVILHSVASISSAPYGETNSSTTEEEDRALSPIQKPQEKLADGVIGIYDLHEESVYSACWSSADPWVFASLSFDGRVAVSVVPSDEKYKIIL